jgi:hypothetical protein
VVEKVHRNHLTIKYTRQYITESYKSPYDKIYRFDQQVASKFNTQHRLNIPGPYISNIPAGQRLVGYDRLHERLHSFNAAAGLTLSMLAV